MLFDIKNLYKMACNARTKIPQKQFGKVTTCKTEQTAQNKQIIITILEVRRVEDVSTRRRFDRTPSRVVVGNFK